MNTRVQGILPMYAIFGGALDFAHNFSSMMPTTLNYGATSGELKSIKCQHTLVHDDFVFLVLVGMI